MALAKKTSIREKLCYFCLNPGVFEPRGTRTFVEAMLKNTAFPATYSRPGGVPLADASVDKLLSVPPWDRQFRAAGGVQSYISKGV